jgi:hypothetical protein
MIDVEIGMSEPALAAAKGRPIITVQLPTVAASQQLIGPQGWLVGWSVRESSGGITVPQSVSGSTAAGAAITAALADVAGSQTFLTGFDVELGVPAALQTVSVTVTGLTGAPVYSATAVAGVGGSLSVRFPQPLIGAAITVHVPACGGAAAVNTVTVYGYTAASAGAIAELVDGQSAGGELLASIGMASGGYNTQTLGGDGIPFRQGLFLSMLAGSVRGSVWVRV